MEICHKKKFKAFIKQDNYYLIVYQHLAKKVYASLSKEKRKNFQLVESIAKEQRSLESDNFNITPANKSYTDFLNKTASSQSIEVLMAAMLPCQWLYQIVYQANIKPNEKNNNPYQKWLNVYQSKSYQVITQKYINLMNEIYQDAKSKNKQLMLKAFKEAVQFEYQFWDDAYRLNV